MRFQTLQEKGMNLPAQVAMIPIHPTFPCSSQNMAPKVLIYVKNATIGGINPKSGFNTAPLGPNLAAWAGLNCSPRLDPCKPWAY